MALYMVVEHFHDRDPVPVYRRFRDRGRLAPDGLHYINSWVSADLSRWAGKKILLRFESITDDAVHFAGMLRI